MKAIRLDNDAIQLLRKRLHGSLCLGQHLEQTAGGGELRVWVPEAFTSVDLGRLNEDIFYPESVDLQSVLTVALTSYLESDPHSLVVADTAYGLDDPRPESLEWFAIDSLQHPGLRRTCAFLKGGPAEQNRLEELLAVASPYPTTLVLTSVESSNLARGALLNPGSPLLAEVVGNVRHIMVGVFDERTMLIWSRDGETGMRMFEQVTM